MKKFFFFSTLFALLIYFAFFQKPKVPSPEKSFPPSIEKTESESPIVQTEPNSPVVQKTSPHPPPRQPSEKEVELSPINSHPLSQEPSLAPPEEDSELRARKALEPLKTSLSDMGFDSKKMVHDYKKGILCKEKNGSLSFYFDLEKNITVLFSGERYIYHFKDEIIYEKTETVRNHFHSASFRRDLQIFYIYDAWTSSLTDGIGFLSISENYPTTSLLEKIFFLCRPQKSSPELERNP